MCGYKSASHLSILLFKLSWFSMLTNLSEETGRMTLKVLILYFCQLSIKKKERKFLTFHLLEFLKLILQFWVTDTPEIIVLTWHTLSLHMQQTALCVWLGMKTLSKHNRAVPEDEVNVCWLLWQLGEGGVCGCRLMSPPCSMQRREPGWTSEIA